MTIDYESRQSVLSAADQFKDNSIALRQIIANLADDNERLRHLLQVRSKMTPREIAKGVAGYLTLTDRDDIAAMENAIAEGMSITQELTH
jgi:hypothetical protein